MNLFIAMLFIYYSWAILFHLKRNFIVGKYWITSKVIFKLGSYIKWTKSENRRFISLSLYKSKKFAMKWTVLNASLKSVYCCFSLKFILKCEFEEFVPAIRNFRFESAVRMSNDKLQTNVFISISTVSCCSAGTEEEIVKGWHPYTHNSSLLTIVFKFHSLSRHWWGWESQCCLTKLWQDKHQKLQITFVYHVSLHVAYVLELIKCDIIGRIYWNPLPALMLGWSFTFFTLWIYLGWHKSKKKLSLVK